MKALILSDIHANILALEAIWAKERDADVIYCAGDLVDYGPFPKEVIGWIRDRGAICVQGNHDWQVARAFEAGIAFEALPDSDRTWAHYNAARLDRSDIAFLAGLPLAQAFALDGHQFGLTHLVNDYDEIVSLHRYETFLSERFPPTDRPISRLVLGHTHRQGVRYLSDGQLWLNPGSVSYRRPDDPDQAAHYAIIVDGNISLRRQAYDLTPLRQATRQILLKPSEMALTDRYFGPRET